MRWRCENIVLTVDGDRGFRLALTSAVTSGLPCRIPLHGGLDFLEHRVRGSFPKKLACAKIGRHSQRLVEATEAS
jgi:hypothetical protein